MGLLGIICACCIMVPSLDAVHLEVGRHGNMVVRGRVVSPKAVDLINGLDTTWRAGVNKLMNKTMDQIKGMLGTRLGGPAPVAIDDDEDDLRALSGQRVTGTVPESFDCRAKWGATCPSVGRVQDQGDCGSCWAIGPATAMTDRCCIAAGKARPPVSTTDILTCCTSCGDGCDGGYPLRAWQYWATNGVVTGGSYGSGEGCQPYCIGPHGPDMEYGDVMKLKCRQSCENQTDKYYKSKTYGKQCKRFRESKMAAVQLDMMKNGPMTASFDVPADFLLYESGVYQPHSDDIVGGHCVTLIGWGVADGQKYWLAKNSWGTDWGEQGFFRFIRSKNVCSFEKEIECAMSDMSRGQNGGKEKSGKGKSQFPRGRGSWPKNRKRISRHS